jgi:hypothetical protein
VELVEEASIQELQDGVSAVDPNGLPGGGGFGLAHGAFDANLASTPAVLGNPTVISGVGVTHLRYPVRKA